MEYSFEIILLIVCPLVFLAGFVDSVAGGGGLISIPAYLFAGLPIHTASGTNKLSVCIGTVVARSNLASALTFIINGKVFFALAIPTAACAIAGNFAGSKLAIKKGSRFIRPFIASIAVLLCVKIIIDIFY